MCAGGPLFMNFAALFLYLCRCSLEGCGDHVKPCLYRFYKSLFCIPPPACIICVLGGHPSWIFDASFVYLWMCPLIVWGDHVKPPLYGSKNHYFMSPHQYASCVCWGATYHEFWGLICVSVYVSSHRQGDHVKPSLYRLYKSPYHNPPQACIICVLGSHLLWILRSHLWICGCSLMSGLPYKTISVQVL